MYHPCLRYVRTRRKLSTSGSWRKNTKENNNIMDVKKISDNVDLVEISTEAQQILIDNSNDTAAYIEVITVITHQYNSQDTKHVDENNIFLTFALLTLFVTLVAFLVFLWKQYQVKEEQENIPKKADNMVFSVRPVSTYNVFQSGIK